MGKSTAPRFTGPAFTSATPETQEAIVVAIDAAVVDGRVHLYPSRIASLDGFEPVEFDATPDVAADLLAHVPPPFYTTAEAAAIGRLLTEPT